MIKEDQHGNAGWGWLETSKGAMPNVDHITAIAGIKRPRSFEARKSPNKKWLQRS